MRHNLIIFTAALMGGISAAASDTTPFGSTADALSLSAPQLAADSVAAGAEISRMKADILPSGPEAEFEYLWSTNAGAENRWSAGISQEFLWPGAYRAARKAEEATSKMQHWQAVESQTRIAAEAEMLFIKLAAGIERLSIQRNISARMLELRNFYQEAFNKGESTILDVNKLNLELARVKVAEKRCMADVEECRRGLINLSPDAELPSDSLLLHLFSSPVSPVIQKEGKTAASMAMEAEARQAEASAAAASARTLPSFSLGYRHAYEEGIHFNGLSASITLPSFGRSRQSKAAAADAMVARMNAAAQQAREQVSRKVLAKNAMILSHALSVLEEAVAGTDGTNSAARQPELLYKALKGGQISVLDYITETNFFLEAKMECVDLKAELLETLAQLRPLQPVAN